MLDLYAFYTVAAITLVAAILVFIQKKILHAVAALAVAFIGSALIFFIIGQTLAALLQLIIFVGGLSTYLIVAVATEQKSPKMIRLSYFAIIAVVFFAGISVLLRYFPSQFPNSGSSFLSAAGAALQTSYASFYIVAFMLLAVATCGVLVIKKFTKLLV